MKQALQPSATVVAVDFARGTVPIGCDPVFYKRMLGALANVLERLAKQVPEGRELRDVETVVCEDGKSLSTAGFLDGMENRYADLAAGITGIEYDSSNALTHPEVVDRALRWLATKRTALN
jgi:hypothetical protein